MSAFSISGPQIVTEHGIIKHKNLTIVNDSIGAISDKKVINCHNFPDHYYIIPGMIDMHIHGSNGADVMDSSEAALATICASLPQSGCTSFLATTMSESKDNIAKAVATVGNFKGEPEHGADILGIHLEGPFISQKRKGAMKEDCIIDPDIALFEHWLRLSQNKIKLVTLAPEKTGAIAFIEFLKKHNIIASVGHSDASFDQTNDAIEAGASHATHLFNAMRGMHHRDPGTAGALILSDQVTAELIADGHHLHPGILQLCYRLKGPKKSVLVTDAIRAQCLKEGEYELGGQTVCVKDNAARLKEDPSVLAGSIVTQIAAARNMQIATQCSLKDIVTMTAETPAKSLNVFDRKGSIAVGKDADLVVLDDKLAVVMTICRGHVAFKA